MYQLIDEKTIKEYFGEDDPVLLKEMIQIILDINIQELKELNHFYSISDFQTIKKRCHKSKPSMSYIGAESTRKILIEIETTLENSIQQNEILQDHLLILEKELNHLLNSIPD
jgi:HPt (histidine-containing phosphotransfer) domain-containing protein